jgi:ABC-type phosphate transport system substrate-binding protein
MVRGAMGYKVTKIFGMVLLCMVLACESGEIKYTPTAGSITIECDESVLPVITLLVNDFQRQYETAKINFRQ